MPVAKTPEKELDRIEKRRAAMKITPYELEICVRLKTARINAGLRDADLAAIFGIDRTTLWKYEAGINRLPLERAIRWCQICGVDYVDVFERGVDPEPDAKVPSNSYASRKRLGWYWSQIEDIHTRDTLYHMVKKISKGKMAADPRIIREHTRKKQEENEQLRAVLAHRSGVDIDGNEA